MKAVLTWAVLVIGFVFTYRQVYLLFAEDELLGDGQDPFERVIPAVLAFLVSLMWPLVLAGWLVWRIAAPKTAAQRREELRALVERKVELEYQTAEAEARLYEAEKALGIRMPPIPPRERS
jgi:hypothetical protein